MSNRPITWTDDKLDRLEQALREAGEAETVTFDELPPSRFRKPATVTLTLAEARQAVERYRSVFRQPARAWPENKEGKEP